MELPAPPTEERQGMPRTHNTELVCPRCQVKGYVRTTKVLWETFADCLNCKSRWSMGRL
jgi:uncharacterized paraquat-inducible protein A